MFDADLAQEIAKRALRTGGSYSDVLFQRRAPLQVKYEDGKVDDVSTGLDSGAGVRVIKGDLAAFAHTDTLEGNSLAKAADAVAESLEYESGGRELTVSGGRAGGAQDAPELEYQRANIARIVEHLEACDEAVRGLGKDIRQVTVIHAGFIEEELLVTSLGEVRRGGSERTRLVVQVVAGRNGVSQVGVEAPGALESPEFYERVDPTRAALTAGRRALVMLEAGPAPAGKMPVVVNGGTGGVLLHEACGHGLEADHVQKGASAYGGRLGEVVASELVTAVDDPSAPGLWGSYEFDDEGTPSALTVLIENGVLKGFLYALHEAMKDELTSTGNGRRQSFRFPPIPRMSNTYVVPGDNDPSDIIASTKRGLYAKKMGGGEVDPVTGDYVFSVSEGYLIEAGKIGAPARGAVLIGNGPRTLELIDAVGNDLSHEEGTCGKDGQGVPVTTGGPTFRIGELTVGGTEVS